MFVRRIVSASGDVLIEGVSRSHHPSMDRGWWGRGGLHLTYSLARSYLNLSVFTAIQCCYQRSTMPIQETVTSFKVDTFVRIMFENLKNYLQIKFDDFFHLFVSYAELKIIGKG